MSRRNLTPPPPAVTGTLAQRRGTGGARREASARIVLKGASRQLDGWALNISRGGIRVLVDEAHVSLGQQFEVRGYNPDNPEATPQPAQVVWVQQEPDGSVIGLKFLDSALAIGSES